MSKSLSEDRDALYYPYIHIRDAAWLKHTLLLFPHVVRMVPRRRFVPADGPFVHKLRNTETKLGPLLRSADLSTPTQTQAQSELVGFFQDDIEREGKAFRKRFGKKAAKKLKKDSQEPGVQIHREKAQWRLMGFLEDHRLAWEPDIKDGEDYLEMHPRVAEAVMTTLAVACARDEGLDVVANPKECDSSRLNVCVAESPIQEIYRRWMHPPAARSPLRKATGRAIFDLVICHHFDLSDVTPEKLAQLSDDREAIARLKRELEKLAASIPAMADDEKLRQRLRAAAADVLRKWKADCLNMSSVSRELFGIDGAKEAEGLVERMVKKALSPELAATGLTGGLLALEKSPVIGIGGGLAVGVIMYAGTALRRARKRSKNSPYRYLTNLGKAGAAFTIGC